MDSNKEINWEERRWMTSTQILAGMCGNFYNPVPSGTKAEDAVRLTDCLISILSGVPLNSLGSELYHSKTSELSK